MTNNSAPRYHPREIKTYVHIKTKLMSTLNANVYDNFIYN